VGPVQATETKKFDPAEDSDDFDAAGDLCDFGFVVTPAKPAAEKRADTIT